MKRSLLLIALLCGGCAHVSTQQENKTLGADGSSHTVLTETHGTAFFSSAQNLAGVKLSNSNTAQSVGVTSVGQQGATNTVATLQALTELLKTLGVSGASGGVVP